MTFTHARCGGVLHPSPQPLWSFAHGTNQPPLVDPRRLELLDWCDRCGLVGLAVEPPKPVRPGGVEHDD